MIDDLYKLYEMYNEEMHQVLENVENYLLKSKIALDIICKNEQTLRNHNAIALVTYDKFFTIISHMLDSARNFNFQLFINSFDKKPMRGFIEALDTFVITKCIASTKVVESLGSNDKGLYMNLKQKNIKLDNKKLKNCGNIDSLIKPSQKVLLTDRQILSCLKNDVSKYKVGSLLKGSITYLQDLETLTFYVCDAASDEFKKIANLKSMIHLRQYTHVPPENEVFGLVLDGTMLRAIREKSFDLTTRLDGKYNVLLLDFGERSIMSDSDIAYRLPEDIQEIPLQAILCKLSGIYGQTSKPLEELKICLQELEYEQAMFLIKSKNDIECTLLLELIVAESKPEMYCKSPEETPHAIQKLLNTNPFLPDTMTSLSEDENDAAVPLHALPDTTMFSSDTNYLLNELTREEMDELAEEPLNTSNAMKAVLGYNPRDEQRLCRFYDPKTGACFKGVNCRLEHTPAQPDGWTKDRLPTGTVIDNYLPTIRYTPGTIINITPTHIGHVEYFYAQINDPENHMEPLIWIDDDIPFHMRLTKSPMIYDLVRARYDDNFWYRAKIIDFDDYGKVFKVFYVDYGNHQNVLLKNLAYCDRSTELLPFQATLCRIADIMQNPEATLDQRENGVRTLNALILNHSFDVKVVSNDEDIIVRFMGAHYSPIPKRLIAIGCAKQFHPNGFKSKK